MKKLFIPAFMVAVLGLASCSTDDDYFYSEAPDFQAEAVFAEESQIVKMDGISKTSFNSSRNYQFVKGDEFAVYNNLSETPSILKNTKSNSTTASFSGKLAVANASEYYGVMPASAASGVEDGLVKVSFASIQNLKASQYDPKSHIFVTYANKPNSYSFKTANSFLLLKNKGVDLVSMTLTANGNENIAGLVDYNTKDMTFAPVDMVSSITLNGPIADGSNYYVAVAPVVLSNGFTLRGFDAEGNEYECVKAVKDLALDRNVVKSTTLSWTPVDKTATLDKALFREVVKTGSAMSIVFDKKGNLVENLGLESTGEFVDAENKIEVFTRDWGGFGYQSDWDDDDDWGDEWPVLPAFKEYYILYDGEICAPSDCSNLFNGYGSVFEFVFNNFKTDNVTIFTSMFEECGSVQTLDLSSFNTSKAESFFGMFYNCSMVVSIVFSENFVSDNVEYVQYMFAGCNYLTTLDLSNFNTSKVSNFQYMFSDCSMLTTIYVDSQKFVVNDGGRDYDMFVNCSSLVGGISWNYGTTSIKYAHTGADGLFTEKSSLAK